MKKRTILFGLFLLVVLAVTISTASACSHPASAQKWVVTKSPTCTTAGFKHYRCTLCCTNLATASVPKLGHKPSGYTVTVQPTFSNPGVKTQHCLRSNCSYTHSEPVPVKKLEDYYSGSDLTFANTMSTQYPKDSAAAFVNCVYEFESNPNIKDFDSYAAQSINGLSKDAADSWYLIYRSIRDGIDWTSITPPKP